MEKKVYQTPVSEEMQVVSVGIICGSAPTLPATPAPRPRGGEVIP